MRSALKGTLARGMARPGKAPTTALYHYHLTVGLLTAGMQTSGRVRCRTIRSRTIFTRGPGPSGTQVLNNLPKDQPGLGETIYET